MRKDGRRMRHMDKEQKEGLERPRIRDDEEKQEVGRMRRRKKKEDEMGMKGK